MSAPPPPSSQSLAQLAAATDHFALFGLPRAFALAQSGLDLRYRELTLLTHPDKAGPSDEAQAAAMELSTRVNEAYQTLRDAEARGNYLLTLMGGPSADDKSLPEGFLTHILALREELEEAQEARDLARLRDCREQAEEGKRLRLDKIAALFALPSETASLKQLRSELNVLRYFQRMIDQIDPKSSTGKGL